MADAPAPAPAPAPPTRQPRNPSPACFRKLVTDHAVRSATGAPPPPPPARPHGPLVPIFIGVDRQPTCADDHVREQLLVRLPLPPATGGGGAPGHAAAAAAAATAGDCPPTAAEAAARLCADLALPRSYENFFAESIRGGVRPFQQAGWAEDDQRPPPQQQQEEGAAAAAKAGLVASDPLRPGLPPAGGGLPLPAPRLWRLPVRVEAPGSLASGRKRRRRGGAHGEEQKAGAQTQTPSKGAKQYQHQPQGRSRPRPRLVFLDRPVWDVARPAASALAYAASAAGDLGLGAPWADAIAAEVSALVEDARWAVRRAGNAAAAATEAGEGAGGKGGRGGGRGKKRGAAAAKAETDEEEEEAGGAAAAAAAVRELEAAVAAEPDDPASLLPRLVEEDGARPELPLLVRLRKRRLESLSQPPAAAR